MASTRLQLKPWEFWECTPHELILLLDSAKQREKQRLDEYIFLAWHTEALARQKRLPKLGSLLKEAKKKKGEKISWEELFAIAERKGLKLPGKGL